jgi:G3E family GTPase
MGIYDDIDDIQIPVYLTTGFLESGKTTFLEYTMGQEYFDIPGRTLLILCEEGEVEYDLELQKKARTLTEILEEPEDLTPDALAYMNKKHRPARVLIEYNGMWPVELIEQMELPKGWGIVQQITTVDASCFQVYMNNLKPLFVQMVKHTDLVIYNRCNTDLPLADFRRSVKVVNPRAEILFEDEAGEVQDIFAEAMPYDLDADVITIREEDYGIWYVDMRDNPEDYEGKTVKFTGMVLKSRDLKADFFVPGRMAMTCCADDTTFIGYICKNKDAPKLTTGSWVEVTATVEWEYMDVYQDEGPVLYAKEIQPCDPLEEELVYFR